MSISEHTPAQTHTHTHPTSSQCYATTPALLPLTLTFELNLQNKDDTTFLSLIQMWFRVNALLIGD